MSSSPTATTSHQIEILALTAIQPVRLLVKGEVRHRAGIGALAAATGALFIDRNPACIDYRPR